MLAIILLGVGAILCIAYGLHMVAREQRMKQEVDKLSLHIGEQQEQLNTWYIEVRQLLNK